MPTISKAEYTQLLSSARKLEEIQLRADAQPFVDKFLDNLGLCVAFMETERWPDWVVQAYQNAERYASASAKAWMELREEGKESL